MNLYIKNIVIFLSILFVSCSNASDQVKLKFGDEVYDALKVWEFLNEVYSRDEIKRIYTRNVNVERINYALYINKNRDTPELRQKVKRAIKEYNDLLGLNFVERKNQESGRALFALVESLDELSDVEFIEWLSFKDQMSEKEYRDFWKRNKEGDSFGLLRYGKMDGKETILGQAILLKPSGSDNGFSLHSIGGDFCSRFYVGRAIPTSIKLTCLKKRPKEGSLMYPIDRAILKTIYQIDGISEMKKERALEEVMDKLLSDYGVN